MTDSPHPLRSKWEYRLDALALEGSLQSVTDRLNELGWEGWELVAVVPKAKAGEPWHVAVLKRVRTGGS